MSTEKDEVQPGWEPRSTYLQLYRTVRSMILGPANLYLNLSSSPYQLCDPEQIT